MKKILPTNTLWEKISKNGRNQAISSFPRKKNYRIDVFRYVKELTVKIFYTTNNL